MTEQKTNQGEMAGSRRFAFAYPADPISRPDFRGAFWGDVETPLASMVVRGREQHIKVFGFQALRTTEAGAAFIDLHREAVQTELTYPVQGNMDMLIRTPREHDVVSHMQGAVPEGTDLTGATFQIGSNNELSVRLADGAEYAVLPTVTPVGSSHGTVPSSRECTYLAVKLA